MGAGIHCLGAVGTPGWEEDSPSLFLEAAWPLGDCRPAFAGMWTHLSGTHRREAVWRSSGVKMEARKGRGQGRAGTRGP